MNIDSMRSALDELREHVYSAEVLFAKHKDEIHDLESDVEELTYKLDQALRDLDGAHENNRELDNEFCEYRRLVREYLGDTLPLAQRAIARERLLDE